MKTINKIELIQQLEVKVEKHLQEAITCFQNLPEEKLLAPSRSGGWSIAQCLEHLNSYGRFYLPAIKRGIDKAEHKSSHEVFKSTWLGSYFTRIMDPNTGKKKFKAFKNHIPSQQSNAHLIVAEFIEQQEAMLQYLRAAKLVDINRVRIPLSISKLITFKLGDAFQFVIAHNERHILQARRNL